MTMFFLYKHKLRWKTDACYLKFLFIWQVQLHIEKKKKIFNDTS